MGLKNANVEPCHFHKNCCHVFVDNDCILEDIRKTVHL